MVIAAFTLSILAALLALASLTAAAVAMAAWHQVAVAQARTEEQLATLRQAVAMLNEAARALSEQLEDLDRTALRIPVDEGADAG